MFQQRVDLKRWTLFMMAADHPSNSHSRESAQQASENGFPSAKSDVTTTITVLLEASYREQEDNQLLDCYVMVRMSLFFFLADIFLFLFLLFFFLYWYQFLKDCQIWFSFFFISGKRGVILLPSNATLSPIQVEQLSQPYAWKARDVFGVIVTTTPPQLLAMIQAFFNNALIVDDDFLITKIISKWNH